MATRPEKHMPELEPYDPFKSQDKPMVIADDRLAHLLEQLQEYLSTRFRKWKADNEFEFELPESQFDHKRNKPIITYLQPDAVQDEGMVGPLSGQQLSGIRATGFFTVNSRRYAIPYKWKISGWLQKGTEPIQLDLYANLGQSLNFLLEAKYLIDIREELGWIWQNFRHIGMLVVGLRSVTITTDTCRIMRELQRRRQVDAFKKYAGRLKLALADYLDVPVDLTGDALTERQTLTNKRYTQICQIASELMTAWGADKKRIVEELEDKYPIERLKEEVERAQHQIFVDLVRSKPDLSEAIQSQIIEFMEMFNLINEKTTEKGNRVSTAVVALNEQMQKDFPIRKYCHRWFSELYTKFAGEISQREQVWLMDQLKRLIPTPYFQDYVEFSRSYDRQYEQLHKEFGDTIQPTGWFTQSYGLFSPYTVDYNPQTFTYSIETSKEWKVDTSNHFWKLMLLWVRLVTGFREVFYVLVRNIWVGNFGIRVLLSTRKFYPEVIVNPATGELGRSPNHVRTPIFIKIRNKIGQIGYIRDKFENAPNSGLFDKRTARVFNLLYCYFVILILKIVIGECLLKPLLIVLNIALSLLLIVTMPVWLPILLLLLSVVDIFFYNFNHQNIYYNYDRVNYFPALRFFLRAFFTVVLIVLKLTIAPLWFLLIALICLIWSGVSYSFRTGSDWLTYQLIKAIGRSPVTDSAMAWRVAGPGIDGSYYQSVKSTDIYLLVTAELEKIHLQMFQQQISSLLQLPYTQAGVISTAVVSRLKGSGLQYNKIYESINYYTQRLSKQIQQRRSVFPSSPGQNIRFTDEEMLSFTKITKEILAKYQEGHPELDMYKHFAINKRNQNKLVRHIWQRIFLNSEVFRTLKSSEVRFDAMKDDAEDDEAGLLADRIREGTSAHRREGISSSVFSALENEDLLLSIYPKDVFLTQLLSKVKSCTGRQLPSSKHDVFLALMLNPNAPNLT